VGEPTCCGASGSGASTDADLVAAAQVLMSLADAVGSRAGTYCVQVYGGHGVQVGDHNTQHNSFGIPTDREGWLR
jgi:hypothetical protein